MPEETTQQPSLPHAHRRQDSLDHHEPAEQRQPVHARKCCGCSKPPWKTLGWTATIRVVVITGAGDRFFCIGGEHNELPDDLDYSTVMPVV